MKKFDPKRIKNILRIKFITADIGAIIAGKDDIPKRIRNRPKIGIIIINIGTAGKGGIFEKNRLKKILEIMGTFGIE